MASTSSTTEGGEESLYPIAVLIDEIRNEDVQVSFEMPISHMGGLSAATIFSYEVTRN